MYSTQKESVLLFVSFVSGVAGGLQQDRILVSIRHTKLGSAECIHGKQEFF